jgi:hypothetical protein
MKSLPQNTYEIQTGFVLGLRSSQECVDWAVNAIVDGFDSPSLRILAACQPPFDWIEIERLWRKSFSELDIKPIADGDKIPQFIAAVIRRTLGQNALQRQALRDFCVLYLERFDNCLKDFYLLHNELEDLDIGEGRWFWQRANARYMHKKIEKYFRDWLNKFDQTFPQ